MILLAVVAFFAIGAPCSGSVGSSIGGESPEDAAVERIDGLDTDLSDMETSCDSVEDPEVGTKFNCRSMTDDGREALWAVLIDGEDHINVTSINLIRADFWGRFIATAADALANATGRPLPP